MRRLKRHTAASQPTELGEARIRELLLKYSLPAIIAMTATSLYNIVDSIFIGHGVGAIALSGLAVAKPFMDICAAFGALVGVGASSLVAIRLGEKNVKEANQVLGNVVVLNVILSTLVMVVGLVWLDPILTAFGASAESLEQAREYMEIILWANVLTHIYFGLNNVLRASGHPFHSMIATIVAVGANIVLDPIFIFTLGMGVRGAALATVLSQAISVVWQLSIFCRKEEVLHFQPGIWSLQPSIVKRVLSIGLSPFFMNIAHCLVVIIVNNELKQYGGDLAIGAYGVINRFCFVFAMIIMGFNQGMQPIAGYNYGARQYDRVLRVFRLTCICASIISGIVFLLGMCCPRIMITIFTHDADLLAITTPALRIFTCVWFLVGFQMVTGHFFTAIGMASKAIFLSLTRQVLYLIPMIILFSHFWGAAGVWWSMPASDLLAAMTAAAMLYVELRKLRNNKSLKYDIQL